MGSTITKAFVGHNNNLETFSLIWLDPQVNTIEYNQRVQQKLRKIINHLKTFDDLHKCQQHISSFSDQDRVILIVSGQLGRRLVPEIHQLRQISSIYVYCMKKELNEEWAKKFSKVKSVVVHVDDLVQQIRLHQKSRMNLEEPLSINICINPGQSTTEINSDFVHSLLLIDVLLRMKSNQSDKQQLITIFENEYQSNDHQLALIKEFNRDYTPTAALRWYTRESFLYKILNKALRTQNIDLLFLFRFMINDIYQQLKENQCQVPIQVYRTQLMSSDELNILQRSINKYISINSFFSTTADRFTAMFMLGDLNVSIDLQRVLFIIDADPSVTSTKPFADISPFSTFIAEGEILFMIGCIFRLINIRQEEDIWVIQMKLCGDNEHDLIHLFQYMKQEYGGGDGEVNVLSFSEVLCDMGKYELAEKINYRLLDELPSNDPSLSDLYYTFGGIASGKDEYETSLQWFQKSLEIILKTYPHDSIKIGKLYSCIGVVYRKKGDRKTALEYYNKAIELFLEANAENHPYIGSFYNNIAIVYSDQKKYAEALNFYEKSLAIYEKQLPPDHSKVANCYNNIGNVYQRLHQYPLAIEYYNRALKINFKSLPIHHPNIALTYKNLGIVYEKKREWKQALTNYKQAATIYYHLLPSEDPCVVEIQRNIHRVAAKLN